MDDEKIVSIGVRQFDKAEDPIDSSPRTAIEKALQEFDDAKDKPTHVIVVFGRDIGDKGCSGTRFFQAGTYRHHAQQGLMMEVQLMIRETGHE